MDIDTYINSPLPCDAELGEYFRDSPALTIFEIGACEGEDTIKLRRKFPEAKIYAFEPLPKNVGRMKKNYEKYSAKNIKIFELALSDKNGTAEFHVSSGHPDDQPKTDKWDYGNKSSSLLPPKEHKKILKWVKFNQDIKVRTRRLDSFCKDESIKAIDFAFIDVQGAELMVLKGAGDILKNIGMVWMEVEAIELYSGQPLKNDVEKFMLGNGFVKINDTVDNISGDQLYVNKRLYKKQIGLFSRVIKRIASK